MLKFSDVIAHQERYNDFRREAEEARFVNEMLPQPKKQNLRLVHRAVDAFGRLLEDWGCRLQKRVAATSHQMN